MGTISGTDPLQSLEHEEEASLEEDVSLGVGVSWVVPVFLNQGTGPIQRQTSYDAEMSREDGMTQMVLNQMVEA